MRKPAKTKRLNVSKPSTLDIDRLAMSMLWSESSEKEYRRNRARSLLIELHKVLP